MSVKLTIIKISFFYLCITLFSFVGNNSHAASVSQLEEQCRNITPQQRQMAKAAGYDVDSACSSLKNFSSNNAPIENVQTTLPRSSSIMLNERGVINSGSVAQGSDYTNGEVYEKHTAKSRDGLVPYGYDLFSGVPTTFAPVTDIPIPVDYMVGPGDSMKIQLLGKVSQEYELTIGRDGAINFPELGPISLAGLDFPEAKKLIMQKISDQMIGVRAVISLGELRSIRIFVLGEAYKPGSYTVSSLSTITNALLVSGGISDVGSLRNIQLKRQGKIVKQLDLYDLLQNGDTSHDARLLPGDVIYVPPVGLTVGIKGEVKRPAIYELKNKTTLNNLITLAGGYSVNAYPNASHITRKEKSGFTSVVNVDLSQAKNRNTQLKNGDLVEISTVLEELENVVKLTGTFQRPRAIKWFSGIKLSDVIHSVRDFEENTDLNIALIIRKTMPLRQISVLHFSLNNILKQKSRGEKGVVESDIALQPMDKIITFESYRVNNSQSLDQELSKLEHSKINQRKIENYQSRDENAGILESMENNRQIRELEELVDQNNFRVNILEPVIRRLKEQTADGQLIKVVEVSGNVRFPGTYPLTKSMNVKDLIMLAGGLKEASYLGNAEVTRRDLSDQETATINHLNVNLAEQLTGLNAFSLQAKDKLAIYSTPEYREKLAITIDGEVRFPGEYEFRRGETLSQVIQRAGGFTSMAHIEASVFTRRDLKLQEAKRLEELKEKLRADLAANNLEEAAAGNSANVSNADELLNALSETEAIGRLVISLEEIVSDRTSDIQLKDGDQLIIPMYRQEISVLGEVQHSTSHLFNEQWTLDDYLEKSGGLTQRADDERIYVVKADGSVFLPTQSGWLTHQNNMLHPGDTVVVPLDTDRIKSLTLWTNVSQIIYQLALGAAAITRL